MNIEVNENLRIRFDSTCWTIEFRQEIKNGKEKGGVRWPTLGYYGNLDQAIFAVLNKHTKFLTGKENVSLSELPEIITKTGERIIQAVKKQAE